MKVTVTLKTGPSELSCGGRNLSSGVPVEVEIDETTARGREQLEAFESEPCVEVKRHGDKPKQETQSEQSGESRSFGKPSKSERKRQRQQAYESDSRGLDESKGFAKPSE